MSAEAKTHREPLIHITKRDDMAWYKAWLIRLASIAAALIVCAVIIVLLTGLNPLEVYTAMFKGTFETERKIWIALQKTAMLLCISLAVTPAFKMKFWNIGAEGQVLMGGLMAAACMINLGDVLPAPALLVVVIVASIAGGCIWALIPAFFKAFWNANETLFTLMMNYVAIQLVSYSITFWENPRGSNKVGIINYRTGAGWLPVLGDKKYLLNIIIVLLLMLAVYIYLKYSKQGYEISVVGESENTARYVGINVKKVIIRTMAISGALCGIAGLLLVAGTDHTISTETAGGDGFTAIMVSWLAKFNPLVMLFVSFLITFLSRGAGEIATQFRLNQSVADILTGVIIFFIIGCEFFVNYKINFRKSQKGEN